VIPESFKQDLLNRIDIVDVISRYVQLKKGGANYLGLCPFHNEKSPSFSVSPAKQFYHCFGCGVHGNAIGFLMAYTALGYVDDESGRRWSAVVRGDYVDGQTFPKLYATYDQGAALPIGHSSVWVRSAAGLSPGDPAMPFANFFFGGFGNNYVDHLDEKRYRAWYSFPGATLNEIGGRNFVKSALEWNLPPWRFRRAGIPAFYATWARPAVFVSALGTNLDAADARRTVTNAGGQIDFRFGVLSVLDLTLSVGGAMALERGHAPRREAMISLKILR